MGVQLWCSTAVGIQLFGPRLFQFRLSTRWKGTMAVKVGEKTTPDVTVRVRDAINTFLGQNFPPGPQFIPMYFVINLQKGGTLPFCLYLMHYYDNYSASALFYTAAHGGYGILWLLKHFAFDDPKWRKNVPLLSAVWAFLLVLGPSWIAPYLLISRTALPASNEMCAFACLLSTVGMVIMIAADCQKHFTLMYKRGLITDGMFRYVRHPNYTGEMMLYAGFALMVRHWAVWAVLAWVWVQLFHTNIMM